MISRVERISKLPLTRLTNILMEMIVNVILQFELTISFITMRITDSREGILSSLILELSYCWREREGIALMVN